MTYSIFHFLTTYKVEEKRDARDLGKGAAAGKEGERETPPAYFCPVPVPLALQFLRSLHVDLFC